MFPSRLDVTFDSNLLDIQALPNRLPAALAHLRTGLLEWFRQQAATVEFALIAFWALTPFAVAALIS